MVQPWADDEPIPVQEEPDADEARDLEFSDYDVNEVIEETKKGSELADVLIDITRSLK